MTKQELLNKKNHSLTMKQLREFVENNKDIPDSAPCVVERVTDIHFKRRKWHDGQITKGWDVLKIEGYDYHSATSWNESMKKEAERRQRGEDPDFSMENPLNHIYGEKKLEEMKEQFYQAEGITTDKEIVYIYSHY